MNIRPRMKNDKGGYACMPLKEHIQEPQSPDWKLTKCPECHEECWEQPFLKIAVKQGATALCTKCVLKKYGE